MYECVNINLPSNNNNQKNDKKTIQEEKNIVLFWVINYKNEK